LLGFTEILVEKLKGRKNSLLTARKSQEATFFVIPVKAEIQRFQIAASLMDPDACPDPDPGFSGAAPFLESIDLESKT